MSPRSRALLSTLALLTVAAIAAPSRGQLLPPGHTAAPLLVKSTTLSRTDAPPGSAIDATLIVTNPTVGKPKAFGDQGRADFFWCDVTPVFNDATPMTVSYKHTKCRRAMAGQPIPQFGPLQPGKSDTYTYKNLIVPDACPAAFVTQIAPGAESSLSDPKVALSSLVYPTRPGRSELTVQSVTVTPDAKAKERRNVTVNYTLKLSKAPSSEIANSVLVEVCRGAKCAIRAKHSPGVFFKLVKEQVGSKLESRYVLTTSFTVSIAADNDPTGKIPSELRVFYGPKLGPEVRALEPRCEDSKTIFKQSFK